MMKDLPERPIRFVHRNRIIEVQGLAPTTTVLSWLREEAACTGTKEGCNEGDCGACTVVVADAAPSGGVRLTPMNACLLFMPALDGRALFTVEDLRRINAGPLHPVQQALVDEHGSQCGFCTPGFVMSIWAGWEQALQTGQAPDRQAWADALSGNLCRCTGYRPILDAAQRCVDRSLAQASPTGRLDRAALSEQLQALSADPPLHYAAHDPALGQIRRFHAPRSSDALADHLTAHPQDRLLGGATDIGLWVNKAHRDVGDLVAIARAQDLDRIDRQDGKLEIGAAVSLERAWSALAEDWPELQDLWRRFASPPVRHAGTLAGNLANGSPIGDSAPVLMGLGASLVLRRGPARRELPLDDFYLGYQRSRLEPGEFIERVKVPRPAPGFVMRAWKVSKRYDCDISAICGGFGLRLAGQRVVEARLAFGGMAATVRRAAHAEQALLQGGWTPEGIAAATAALTQDFQPLSDLRSTAEHRMRTAEALLQRLWLSLQPQAASRTLEVWR